VIKSGYLAARSVMESIIPSSERKQDRPLIVSYVFCSERVDDVASTVLLPFRTAAIKAVLKRW